ncbi:uncharacterized protein KQ657_000512 [Scheffersomyces spartinae]|uniref:Putative transcription factor kapC n=1 Tax=Scheffersomyces spartinae TaxID=45513 RepID=A0A9P7V9K0_9ASCO|nr:uncharacterized protein KQ657_000512 [Scheffersomyces spartinae]KAG7193818.1 hypothetical protein KQ657_000512 [Scheffersomyces spartinae]
MNYNWNDKDGADHGDDIDPTFPRAEEFEDEVAATAVARAQGSKAVGVRGSRPPTDDVNKVAHVAVAAQQRFRRQQQQDQEQGQSLQQGQVAQQQQAGQQQGVQQAVQLQQNSQQQQQQAVQQQQRTQLLTELQQHAHSQSPQPQGQIDSDDEDMKKAGAAYRRISSDKRAAQNRQAQKAFRQRREKYIKDLEAQVAEVSQLKQTIEELRNENLQLRDYTLALQSKLLEINPPGGPHTSAAQAAAVAAAASIAGGTNGLNSSHGSTDGVTAPPAVYTKFKGEN